MVGVSGEFAASTISLIWGSRRLMVTWAHLQGRTSDAANLSHATVNTELLERLVSKNAGCFFQNQE